MEAVAMIGKGYFLWLRRTPNRTFANDPMYRDPVLVMAEVARKAIDAHFTIQQGIYPLVGWVRKRRNQDYYQPCGEFTDGAVPAWIWTAR
jgi:hypothetical protein